ncbi:MAG: choice-of-anchor D domain-containing protein [Myxococcota bacterium]|jgi:hypothetical protein
MKYRSFYMIAAAAATFASVISCSDDSLNTVMPDIALFDAAGAPLKTVEFGRTALEYTATFDVMIKNTVTKSVDLVSSLSLRDSAGKPVADGIVTVAPVSVKVGALAVQKVTVTFTPPEEKVYSYAILIESKNARTTANRKITLPVNGAGMLPKMVIGRTAFDFGSVVMGTSRSEDTKITNEGTGPLTIFEFVEDDPDSVFTISDPDLRKLPLKVEVGKEMVLRVVFAPNAEKTFSGSYTIKSDDPVNRSMPVTLTGIGLPRPPEDPPVAVITCPAEGLRAPVPEEFTLDGTKSTDPKGLSLTYSWSVKKDVKGNYVAPTGSDWCYDCDYGRSTRNKTSSNSKPVFFADIVGDYTLTLSVRNEKGVQSLVPAECVLHGYPRAWLQIELVGSNPVSDLDIHIINNSSGIEYTQPKGPDGLHSCPCDCRPSDPSRPPTVNPDWGIPIPYTADCLKPAGNPCDLSCKPRKDIKICPSPADGGVPDGAVDDGGTADGGGEQDAGPCCNPPKDPNCYTGGADCILTCSQDETVPYLQAAIDDNPRYGIDVTDSKSPEVADIPKPSPGNYGIYVYYFEDSKSSGQTTAGIRLFFKGTEVKMPYCDQETMQGWSFCAVLPNKYTLWKVGTVTWPAEGDPVFVPSVDDLQSIWLDFAATCKLPPWDGGYPDGGQADGGM